MKRHTSAAGGKRCPPMAFESGQTCNETRFHADASRRKYFCSQYDWIIRHASTMRALWKTTICDAARGGAASPQYFRTILFLEESAQNDRAFPSGNGRRWLRPACRGKQDMPLPTPKYKPTFVPLMTPSPALDGIWPPPGNRGPYRVGRDPSINWKILAWSWGLTDVWDLIWFQFVTDDPREVNWYMHYYLGCWKSNDGKNFSFKDADPGLVYIPPLGYKSPATVVAGALSAKVAHFPYVAYKHVHIDRTYLLAVIRHIRSRRIKVRFDSKLGKDTLAAYYGDTFWLNDSALTSGMNMSLTLVHEATHAILDLQKAAFFRSENELIAHLAEALCKLSGVFRERPLVIPEKAAALARHIIADKAGGTFIRLDDYVDVAAFQNLKSEIIKAHPKIWTRVIRGDGI
jgi:hypothetical protein